MSSPFDWDPVVAGAPLIVTGLVILALLLVAEWRRRQKFRAVRMISQVLIVLSILGILCRPSRTIQVDAGPTVLLTPGYDPKVIDSLAREMPGASIVRTPDAAVYKQAGVKPLREVKHLFGNPLLIVGSGLPPYVLEDLPSEFRFISSGIPNGITQINIPNPVVAEARSSIVGSYLLNSTDERTILLLGPGGAEDSVRVSGPGHTQFSLEFIPTIAGNAMYRVEEKDTAGNTTRSSMLPIHVEPLRTLDLLIVSDYPSFELRYLKNFLADKGHRISVRSRVSKDRFHQEFANRSRQPLDQLSTELLTNMDVILMDHGTYLTMQTAERNRVNESIKNGLGIIFLGPLPNTGPLITFEKKNGPDTVRMAAEGVHRTLPVMPVSPRGDVSSVVESENGQVVAGCRCSGDVRVGYQLLRETYQLGLQNHTAAYSALWTPLFDKVTRTRQSNVSIALQPAFPVFTDEPTDVAILSSGTAPSSQFDSSALPLIEDARIDGLWYGKIWASGSRWHTLTSDSARVDFFDLPSTEWETLRTARQQDANRTSTVIRSEENKPVRQQSWALAFFVVFVIASGFLWVIPKV